MLTSTGRYDDEAHFVVYQENESNNTTNQVQRPSPARAKRHEERMKLLPPSLETSALKNTLFQAGWVTLHPSDTGADDEYSWIPALPSINANQAALHCAYAAVTLARVGQQEKNPSFIRQCHVAYAGALTRTQKRLAGPNWPLDDETFACILLLAVFEVCVVVLATSCDLRLTTRIDGTRLSERQAYSGTNDAHGWCMRACKAS